MDYLIFGKIINKTQNSNGNVFLTNHLEVIWTK